ncbi:MAG: recombinase family protein [Mobilitalea sp.]
MKNINFREINNMEEREQPTGLGVVFVKTRKADDKIWELTEAMVAFAEATDVQVVDVIVDESSGCDIDREEIDLICDWIENSPIGIIFVQAINHITRDQEDLDKFLNKAARYGMIIVDIEAETVMLPRFDEEESEC